MHDESREVVKFLKFISKIQKGEKINIYGMFTQSEGIVTSFSRTFINRDNRQNTLNFIEKNINNGISLIDKYIESKNINFDYVMVAAFPSNQSKIYDYNRVIKDLNGLTKKEFIEILSKNFVVNFQNKPFRPGLKNQFGMYHENKWYSLDFKIH